MQRLDAGHRHQRAGEPVEIVAFPGALRVACRQPLLQVAAHDALDRLVHDADAQQGAVAQPDAAEHGEQDRGHRAQHQRAPHDPAQLLEVAQAARQHQDVAARQPQRLGAHQTRALVGGMHHQLVHAPVQREPGRPGRQVAAAHVQPGVEQAGGGEQQVQVVRRAHAQLPVQVGLRPRCQHRRLALQQQVGAGDLVAAGLPEDQRRLQQQRHRHEGRGTQGEAEGRGAQQRQPAHRLRRRVGGCAA